jgi:rRNA maturation RNase YbeY
VLLATDEEVQDLNRRFREIDEPTDVLTFPAQPIPGQEPALGDIAIAVPYAARQAQIRGIKTEEELQYLAIHGALHLLGWDDETEPDRAKMFAEMDRVGRLAGLPPEPEWCSLLHQEAS